MAGFKLARVAKLAGVEGFEPPYGGIKTRCLTAWRHPNLKSKLSEPRSSQPAANLSSKGESFNPRTQETIHRRAALRARISRPRSTDSTAKKTQAPVPVRRATPKPDSQSSARATSGYRRLTTPQAVVPPTRRQETVNCDGRRIPCQFRILKYFRRPHHHIRL